MYCQESCGTSMAIRLLLPSIGNGIAFPVSSKNRSLEEGDNSIGVKTMIEVLNLTVAPMEPICGYIIESLEHGTKSDISSFDSGQNLLNDLIVKCIFPRYPDTTSFRDVPVNFINN